jgi:hypothetical protein
MASCDAPAVPEMPSRSKTFETFDDNDSRNPPVSSLDKDLLLMPMGDWILPASHRYRFGTPIDGPSNPPLLPPMQNFNYQNFNTGKPLSEYSSLEQNDTQSNFGASGMNWRSEDVYDLGDQNCRYTQTSWGGYTSTEQGYSRVRLFHAEISKLFERDYVWGVTQTMVSFNRKTLWLVFRVFPFYGANF